MKRRESSHYGYVVVVVILAATGVAAIGFIPGVGIFLLLSALAVGAVALSAGRATPAVPLGLWLSLVLALLGVTAIAVVDPLVGAFLLLAGMGLAIGSALRQRLEGRQGR